MPSEIYLLISLRDTRLCAVVQEGRKSANAAAAQRTRESGAEAMCNWDNRENTLQYGIATAFRKESRANAKVGPI